MAFCLHPEASFCVAAGHVIFLHSGRDRYLMLPSFLNAAMLGWLSGPPDEPLPASLADMLLDAELIVTSPPPGHKIAPFVADAGKVSIKSLPASVHIGQVIEVWLTYRRTRHILRRLGFAALIERLPRPSLHNGTSREASRAAQQFLRCRTLLSIKEDCLIESMSMLAFLRGQGCMAEVVFGVTAVPFQAHCWVQSEGMLLNDHPDHVSTYTPIRRA